MKRVEFSTSPSFTTGKIYRKSENLNTVPIASIKGANVNISMTPNLFYRKNVGYGEKNTTPSDYDGYNSFANGTGMLPINKNKLPIWQDGKIFTSSNDEFRKVPSNLYPLSFIPNLFYTETVIYTETAKFGKDGARVGNVKSGHANFNKNGMEIFISEDNKIASFGVNSKLKTLDLERLTINNKDVTELIKVNDLFKIQEFNAGSMSFSAGTIGTRGAQKKKSIKKEGYIAILVAISYIASSDVCNPMVFFNDVRDSVYVNLYRATKSSYTSDNPLNFLVTYMKEN